MANNQEEPERHGESSRLSPRTSTHGFQKVTSKRPRDRAPTDRDMDHIKDNLQHRTPHPSRWVFEKVIRNSQNHQKHERILHLLALIDENNNIQEVGLLNCMELDNRTNDFETANDCEDSR
jgi:hypothetical protein